MHLTYHPIQLKLKHTFRISRSAADTKTNVIVSIDEGIGEAAPSEYYNENTDTVIECLEKSKDKMGDDSFRASLSFDTESQDEVQDKPPPERSFDCSGKACFAVNTHTQFLIDHMSGSG